MTYTKLKLKLTKEQYNKLLVFVEKNKIKFNIDEYALITQPTLVTEQLGILFLTSKESQILSKAFYKIKHCK